ncbi:MAG TPA: acyltransferase family protein [Dyella sp.]|uniref:acyltransferase family protein n=1 Tax=Dyella sp. TaxID=1869338 RepID=UPI002F95287A
MQCTQAPQYVESHQDVAADIPVVATSIPRLAGLDGLRAIAVLAVVLFHADIYEVRGGYLGVDLFFVISGFLITSLMAREIESTGRLNLWSFFARRAKRLLPAAWLMIVCVVTAAAFVARDALPHLRHDAIASLAYVTNWELLRSQTSYFEAIGRPPLLQHLWSLAIEEQFYIVWAPLAFTLLPRLGRLRMAVVVVAFAIASATWMAWLAHGLAGSEQNDTSRLYFGTDTHGFALLFGAALGLLWRPLSSENRIGPFGRFIGWMSGGAALMILLVLFATMGENTSFLYPWGFLGATAASIVLIAVVTHPGLALGRHLDVAPMRWIGERSYGIYLWHWPIFMLMRPSIDLRLDRGAALTLAATLTLIVSAWSYRYLELPVRHGLLGRLLSHARHRVTIILTVVLAVSTVGAILWQAPIEAKPAQDVSEALRIDLPTVSIPAQEVTLPVPAASSPELIEPVIVPDIELPSDESHILRFTGHDLTAVGDSVLLGTSQLLKASLPGSDVHATMGWQAADILRELKTLKDAGALRTVALVHLGTNGYVTEKQLRQILTLLGDCQRVILINSRVPRRWMEANNALIDSITPDFPNVTVVDWSDISDNQPDYFVSDGVHLTSIGQRALVSEIMRVGHLARDDDEALVAELVSNTSGDLSDTLVLAPQAAASDDYWRKLAHCETDTNWQQPGRRSGGLGIVQEDWIAWGGTAFAPIPAQASPAQQIDVANRISTQGWTSTNGDFVRPVGFTRWRCVAAVGYPPSNAPYMYTRESVLLQDFHLGERGAVVRDLQRILGVTPDGIYNKKTRKKHLAYLRQNELPESRAGTNR